MANDGNAIPDPNPEEDFLPGGPSVDFDAGAEEVEEVVVETVSWDDIGESSAVDIIEDVDGEDADRIDAIPHAPMPVRPKADNDGDDAPGIVVAAEKFLVAGNFEDALALAQEAVREQSSPPKARVIMARAFMGLGEHAKALAVLQAFSKADETVETLHLRGVVCAKLNRSAEALNFLQASLSMAGGDPRQQRRARELIARLKRKRNAENIVESRPPAARPKPIERMKRRRRMGCLPKVLIGLGAFLFVAAVFFFTLWKLAPGLFTFLGEYLSALPAEIVEYLAKFKLL